MPVIQPFLTRTFPKKMEIEKRSPAKASGRTSTDAIFKNAHWLPFHCPRGLSRLEAARYIGVSAGTFDRLVEDGSMPKPKRVRTRLVWDRVELDFAFDAFGEPSDDGRNDWD